MAMITTRNTTSRRPVLLGQSQRAVATISHLRTSFPSLSPLTSTSYSRLCPLSTSSTTSGFYKTVEFVILKMEERGIKRNK
ncbi:unnamed protein product [Cochlearia groenlandica]